MMEMSAALMSEKQQSMQFERKWKSECQVMSSSFQKWPTYLFFGAPNLAD
jgi:hypothetical protein